MTDYINQYLKYKIKYLMLKEGSRIHIDNMIKELVVILENIETSYDEVYVAGSMGVLLLAYFLDHNMIPTDYPIPDDIDFIVFNKDSYNSRIFEIRDRRFGNFTRLQETFERSATFEYKDPENYFQSFDLIATNKPQKYHVVNFFGTNIKILLVDHIKREYEINLDSSLKKEKDLIKLNLLNKVMKKDLNVEFNEIVKSHESDPRSSRELRRNLFFDSDMESDDEILKGNKLNFDDF